MPPKKKQPEDSDSDIEFIPNLRKSARIASKTEATPSRADSVDSSTSSVVTPGRRGPRKGESVEPEPRAITPARRGAKKAESVEPVASSAVTPTRRGTKKAESVEPSNAVTPARRHSTRLHPEEQSDELLELPTPSRRRTTSTSSSIEPAATPRRTTRASVKELPVLAEEEALRTPPPEDKSKEQDKVPDVPPSAQKRYANLAMNLTKMLVDTPVKMVKSVFKIAEENEEEEEEEVVLPVKQESPKKEVVSPKKESPKKAESPKKEPESPKKESPKKADTPKVNTPKMAESPKKAETPKVNTPKRSESPKKAETPKVATPKESPKKQETPKPQAVDEIVDVSSDDEPMEWQDGPLKTPIMFHKTPAARLAQLVPDEKDTPTTRSARRGRPSSAVIFGEGEKEEAKDLVLPAPSPAKKTTVTPAKEATVTPAKEATVSPVKKEDTVSPKKASPVKEVSPVKAQSPKKSSPVKKDVVKEEEEGDEEEEDEDEAEDEEMVEDEDGEEEADEEEEEEEVVKTSPKKSPGKVEQKDKKKEEEEEKEDEEEEVVQKTPKKSPAKSEKKEDKTQKKVVEEEEDMEDEDAGDEDEEEEEMEDEEGEDEEEEEEEEEEVVQKSPKKGPAKSEKKDKKKVVEDEIEEEEEEDMDDEEELDEDEEEEAGSEDEVDGLFPAVSFQKVFDGSVDFDAALKSVYKWAFARGSSRHDDLPGLLVNAADAEAVWQQIDHRNGQIAKDCKKAKKAGLFEKDIELTESSEKKGKGRKRRAEEEEDEEEMEDDAQFDDEDLLMDEDEEEGEEGEDEEEEEGNLFDMTEEQLARLDDDWEALKREDEEQMEEEEEERPRKKKKKAEKEKKKKFPKSSVDDRFFSLAEMEAAADAMEKDGAIEEGILDDGEEEGGDAAYTYDEFFGAGEDDGDVFGEKKDKKKKKMKGEPKRDQEDEYAAVARKAAARADARKSVSWADDGENGGELREERLIEASGKMRRLTALALAGDEEEEEGQGKKEGGEGEEEERILLGPADEEVGVKTQLKASIKSIKKRIAQLEEENLEARKWDLQGEVGGAQRGENTLLEQHVEFDHGMTRAPTITEDFNAKIEAIVLQRWKDKAWDDPVRTVRQEERTDEYRNKLVDEDLLIKQSLSSVYEKEYEKAQEGAAAASGQPAVNPKHAEIDADWDELFGLIDPLFHFNVTPQQAKAEVRVITNMRALQREEVGAMASTEEMLVAPEEIKKREKGELKGKEERDATDKKRERRKKKQKQRAVVMVRGEAGLKRMLERDAEEKEAEAAENGEPKRKKKKKKKDTNGVPAISSGAGGGKFKSTDFFTKLQATVQNELVEKTKKSSKKAKAAAGGSANSAKFKL